MKSMTKNELTSDFQEGSSNYKKKPHGNFMIEKYSN